MSGPERAASPEGDSARRAGLPPLATDAQAPAPGSAVPDAVASVLRLLAHRRSISPVHMRPDPVPDAWLDAILEASRWAPTHGKNEPWRLVVYRGDAAMSELAAARHAGYLQVVPPEQQKAAKLEKIETAHARAPVAIAVGCLAGANPRIPAHEDRAAVSCAVQNLSLAATAFGLGSFWSTGALAYSQAVRDATGFLPPVEPMGFIFVGFPAKPWPEGRRGALSEKVVWKL